MIFDTHAHYDAEAFEEDREVLLSSMEKGGIGRIIDVSAEIKDLDKVIALAEKYPFVYAATGVHPDDAEQTTDEVLEKVRRLSEHPKTVAIGEIGLDYYWHKEPETHEVQKKVFQSQMEIARETGLPFIIHSRDAAADTFEIVKEWAGSTAGGVLHCFSGSLELAREYVKMGLFIGIGGVVTFKNSRKLKEVAAGIPLENIVLETDCPYLAPVPYRGKRNCSLYLPYVVRTIAELRGITEEEVIGTTWENAFRLFPKVR